MKKLLLALVLLACGPAAAQWQVPNNTIPVGRGPGVSGFNSVANTGTGTLCLLNTAPPTFGTCPGATSPGGSPTQLQYNNAGSFGGVTGATFSGGVLVLPAHTLSGTISGGGNQLNNVIVGNVTPLAGGFTNVSANTVEVGTNAALPTGTIFSVSNNVGFTIPGMAGFAPQAVIVGADASGGALAIQSYNNATGGEARFLGFGARGTMGTPLASQLGDFVGELGFHPFDGTNFVHNAGSVIIGALTENTTPTNAGQELRIYTTPTGTATAFLNTTFNASGGHTINGATSGGVKITVPAVAGANTLTLPAGTTDFSATGGTSQFVKQNTVGGALTVVQPTFTDLATGSAPAFTLGGTVSGGNNQLNNVVIGNVSPRAGAFTNIFADTLTATPALVSSLPACNSGTDGQRRFVTDNNTAVSFGGAVTGGGATHSPIYCDGSASAWKQG